MDRVLSAACVVMLLLGVSVSIALAQEADDTKASASGKPAATPAPAGDKPAPSAPQQPPKDWTNVELGGVREPYAEIARAATGKPIVAIHYPWRVHSRPSVEIRYMADDEPDTARLRPLQFVADIMKGEITNAVYECRDKSADGPLKTSLKHGERDLELLGARNLLGKRSVTVVFPGRTSGEDRAARAVFCLLDSWAVDPRTLWLELPRDHFARPGRIRVWFYRGGNLVWWKTLAWPGLQ